MEYKPFFGTDGITSTSANHYANLAKEASRKYFNALKNIRFFDEKMRIIGESSEATTKLGIKADRFDRLKESVKVCSQLHSLIAYLREAIKEKERLLKEAEQWENKEALEDFEARHNELLKLKPVRAEYKTEDDIIRTWTIGEQEHFLSLEAEASVYGNFIHEDGAFSKARIALLDKLENPTMVNENGRDTIIYTYEPTVGQDEVDEMYFAMQAHHREVQAELNGMKKRIEDALNADMRAVDEEYKEAFRKWSIKKDQMDRELVLINEEMRNRRKDMIEEISALKIVVPNRLRNIVEALKKL